jgi:hypothetical protein
MFRFTAAAFAVLCLAASASAAPLSYPLTVTDGKLGGAGADVLRGEIARSEFIQYGEDHGFADSPSVLRAIAREAKPFGFNYHIIEVGPESTAIAADALRKGGVPALGAIVHQYPLSLPFIAMREDAELASDFLGHDAGGAPLLWGIDQEFVGAPVLLLKRLVTIAPNAAAKTAAEALLAREEKAAASGDPSAFVLFTLQNKDFADLAAKFAGNAEAQRLIAAMRESAAIYQLYNQRKNYASNARRSRLLVANFLAAMKAAGTQHPKVIFKMGAEHTALGMTSNNTFDPGSVASVLALTHGSTSLRILFLPAGGHNTHIAPAAGNPFKVEAYDDPDTNDFFASIGVDKAALAKDSWTLIPLEPVRETLETAKINALKPMTKFLLLGFDYVITTPDAKPATPLY